MATARDVMLEAIRCYATDGDERQATEIPNALADAGFVIVPKEPTEAMCWAGEQGAMDYRDKHCHSNDAMAASWRAMVDAG